MLRPADAWCGIVRSFLQLTEEDYWLQYSFNRTVPNFVIQAGCPDTDEGFAYCEHLLAPEIRLPSFRCTETARVCTIQLLSQQSC